MIDEVIGRKGWYIDRGVNPAYIVPLISAIIACLIWAGTVNSHFAVTDKTLQQHEADDKTTERRVDKLESLTDERLTRMEAKMDRIIEGQKRFH